MPNECATASATASPAPCPVPCARHTAVPPTITPNAHAAAKMRFAAPNGGAARCDAAAFPAVRGAPFARSGQCTLFESLRGFHVLQFAELVHILHRQILQVQFQLFAGRGAGGWTVAGGSPRCPRSRPCCNPPHNAARRPCAGRPARRAPPATPRYHPARAPRWRPARLRAARYAGTTPSGAGPHRLSVTRSSQVLRCRVAEFGRIASGGGKPPDIRPPRPRGCPAGSTPAGRPRRRSVPLPRTGIRLISNHFARCSILLSANNTKQKRDCSCKNGVRTPLFFSPPFVYCVYYPKSF